MPALYVVFAVLSALLYAVSITANKTFVTTRLESDEATAVLSALILFSVTLLCSLVFSLPLAISWWLFGAFAVTGTLYTVAMYLYFRALRQSDATAVSTLISLEALTTPLLAMVLLRESLTLGQGMGVGLVICGVLLLALTRDGETNRLTLNTAAVLIVAAVFLWGFEDTLLKYTLGHTTWWAAFFWTRFFGATSAVALTLGQPAIRNDVLTVVRSPLEQRFPRLVVGETFGGIGMLFVVLAYANGPVSIVTPITTTYTIFVFVFAAILQWWGYTIEEQTSRAALLKKVIAALLAFTGIVLLA